MGWHFHTHSLINSVITPVSNSSDLHDWGENESRLIIRCMFCCSWCGVKLQHMHTHTHLAVMTWSEPQNEMMFHSPGCGAATSIPTSLFLPLTTARVSSASFLHCTPRQLLRHQCGVARRGIVYTEKEWRFDCYTVFMLAAMLQDNPANYRDRNTVWGGRSQLRIKSWWI